MAEKVVNTEQKINGQAVRVRLLEERACDMPQSNIVLVSGLPEGVTENNVHIHFQKKKNGGGEVLKVEMLGEGKAKVVFEKPEGSLHKRCSLYTCQLVLYFIYDFKNPF